MIPLAKGGRMSRHVILTGLLVLSLSPVMAKRYSQAEIRAGKEPYLFLTSAQCAQMSVYAPKPEYTYEARTRRITGSGIFRLQVQLQSGLVKSSDRAQHR
jgi:hypothetical protein